MLAGNGDRPEKAAMAQIYFKWAKALEGKQAWGDASAAYSKAYGLDPKGAQANEALAAHHFTLGKSLEAAGKDGGPDYRKAIAIMPTYGTAMKSAADAGAKEEATKRPIWMLYAAIGSAALALGLFAAAMLRRRG
jgi:tetratricopeptide (TPR) repeat protein